MTGAAEREATSRPADYDVLVCGLGPVGQLLALLLGERGVSVLAIDAASAPFELPRAAVVDDEVLRIFQAAGVAEEILEASQTQEDVSFVRETGGPVQVLRPVGGSQGHPPLVSIHQPTIERTLASALEGQRTVEARWGCRLESLSQDERGEAAGVEATLRSADDGSAETVRARWLVGCDGGPSWVRQLLGVEFGGSTFRQRWLVVDVEVDRPLEKVPHPHFYGDWRRPAVSLPMSPGRHRWEWMLHPGEDPEPFLDQRSVRERIEPWLSGETARVERAVVYTFHARTAARWRHGRVLLAGDAAHLMPPFAGQGLSSGARDAANLAWKLDAVLRGAPEALIDTYERERRPHVAAMTRLAVSLGRFVQTTDRRVARLRDALLRALEVSGLAEVGRRRLKPLPTYGAGAFAERPSRLAPRRGVGSQFPQPHVRVDGGECLLDQAIGPEWIALTLDAADAESFAAGGTRAMCVGRDLEDVDGAIGAWLERFAARWVVLRPDRFVFALGGSETGCVRRALDALHRQLGPAAFVAEAAASGRPLAVGAPATA